MRRDIGLDFLTFYAPASTQLLSNQGKEQMLKKVLMPDVLVWAFFVTGVVISGGHVVNSVNQAIIYFSLGTVIGVLMLIVDMMSLFLLKIRRNKLTMSRGVYLGICWLIYSVALLYQGDIRFLVILTWAGYCFALALALTLIEFKIGKRFLFTEI